MRYIHVLTQKRRRWYFLNKTTVSASSLNHFMYLIPKKSHKLFGINNAPPPPNLTPTPTPPTPQKMLLSIVMPSSWLNAVAWCNKNTIKRIPCTKLVYWTALLNGQNCLHFIITIVYNSCSDVFLGIQHLNRQNGCILWYTATVLHFGQYLTWNGLIDLHGSNFLHSTLHCLDALN